VGEEEGVESRVFRSRCWWKGGGDMLGNADKAGGYIMVMEISIGAISEFRGGRWDVEVVIELLSEKFKVFEDSIMNSSGKEAGDAEVINGRLLKWGY